MKGPNERYHDRVAAIYDDIYEKSLYWRFYRDLTWHAIRPRLPREAGARIADLGCGTGEWGLRCAASGFRVTFADLSNEMLCRARDRFASEFPGREASFVRADIADLHELDTGQYALVIAQGDPLSFTADPVKAVREIARILAPGGHAVASVDNRCASYDHYLEQQDLDGLLEYHKSGRTQWLARDPGERFTTRGFFPSELRKLFEKAGLEVVDLAGKTLLDTRRNPQLLADPRSYRKLLAVEAECRREPGFIGRAAHLEIVARKPAAPARVERP